MRPLVASAVLLTTLVVAPPAGAAAPTSGLSQVVPAPASVRPSAGRPFEVGPSTVVRVSDGAGQVGQYLAGILRPSTGYRIPVVPAWHRHRASGISLLLDRSQPGAEGYRLDVDGRGVVIRARTAAGLFSGVQTLRQLLPARVESSRVQRGPWPVPAGRILDAPRFAHRGAMLDVVRHFFSVAEVKRYI